MTGKLRMSDELDKLYCKFDELDKLCCKFDELDKLDCKLSWISSMSWISWIS